MSNLTFSGINQVEKLNTRSESERGGNVRRRRKKMIIGYLWLALWLPSTSRPI